MTPGGTTTTTIATNVLGENFVATTTVPTQVLGESVAFTGLDARDMLIFGGLLIFCGGVLLAASGRRRRYFDNVS